MQISYLCCIISVSVWRSDGNSSSKSERHPELTEGDVRSAWENQYRCYIRATDTGSRHVAIGCDTHGREIVMVAVKLEGGNWLVFHAMTPPSAKTYNELGMGRKR